MSEETHDKSDIYRSVSAGLVNVVSGLGTRKARDPSTYLGGEVHLDRIELEDIYRHYWISKAVDIKPFDMTREWRTFEGEDIKPEQIKAIEEEERRIEVGTKVRSGLKWASLYGGSGIIMHVDGHGEMSEELDYTKIKKGQLNRLSTADRWELYPYANTIDYNPLSPTYKTAEFYRVAHDTTGQMIHRSRIIFLRGREMPIRITRQLLGWGESDVQRWYRAITNSETLSAAIIEGVHQANIDVVKADGLAQTLSMKGGDEKIKDRFMLMDYCKSLLNMAIIDGKDEFTRNAFPFSGLPDLHRTYLEVLAGATDIPVTRLLGSSPAGFNATGEGDTRNYYDMIAALQNNDLRPALYQLDQVMIRSALGNYPESLRFEFESLWQRTDEEQAEVDSKRALTLASLFNLGIPQTALMKDAIELGLVKNLTVEEVGQIETEEDSDFGLNPEDEGEGSKKGKAKNWKTDGSGKQYYETSAGNRVYEDR